MALPPRTVNDIIVNAFYLAGINSPDEVPSGQDIHEGQYLLTSLLDHYTSSGIYLPFIKELEFTMTPNKDTYSISDVVPADIVNRPLASLDFVNIQLSTDISYPVNIIERVQLFKDLRIKNLSTRPAYVILERAEQSTSLKFYPLPDQAYECTVRGKFFIEPLELNDRLDEVPFYYHRFLRYALARELSSVYSTSTWKPIQEKEYSEMLKTIASANDIELGVRPSSLLQSSNYFNNYWDSGFGTGL